MQLRGVGCRRNSDTTGSCVSILIAILVAGNLLGPSLLLATVCMARYMESRFGVNYDRLANMSAALGIPILSYPHICLAGSRCLAAGRWVLLGLPS